MLPPFNMCQHNISAFIAKYPAGHFTRFWQYKQSVENNPDASILDEDHLDQTTKLISAMLNSRAWGMARTGIPPYNEIKSILRGIASTYLKIRDITLGGGKVASIRKDLSLAYRGLRGIANTNQRNNDPDRLGRYFIVGKAKVLMFIWGQTPGFDRVVRENFRNWIHPPPPSYLPHLLPQVRKRRRYTPDEFCIILEELDRWVQAWPQNNGGKSFQVLLPGWPPGRIVDVVYLRDP